MQKLFTKNLRIGSTLFLEYYSKQLTLVLRHSRESKCETSCVTREVKFDFYGKRLTAKIKFLPSVFSSLYRRIKIFLFAVNSKRHFSIFVGFI